MIIRLFQNNSDTNVMQKSITLKAELTGTLRDDCSIIDPIVKIEGIAPSDLKYINYAEIPDFGRYYYVNNIILKGKLFECHMHVDVLKTYNDKVRAKQAIIARQENSYNLLLSDGLMKTYANPNIEIKQFPGGFTDYQYIFCVAG